MGQIGGESTNQAIPDRSEKTIQSTKDSPLNK